MTDQAYDEREDEQAALEALRRPDEPDEDGPKGRDAEADEPESRPE